MRKLVIPILSFTISCHSMQELPDKSEYSAYFFCVICAKDIPHAPPINIDFLTHLKQSHKGCQHCLSLTQAIIVTFATIDSLEEHIAKEHPSKTKILQASDKA